MRNGWTRAPNQSIVLMLQQCCDKVSAMLTSHRIKRWRVGTDHVITSFQEEPAAISNPGIICIREEMASMEVLGSVPLANTFLGEPKKRKKKKAKKPKREKLDKLKKSKPKDHPSLKDCADMCDSNLFAQWPKVKKKKRKKKPDVSSNEEFPLTQNRNLKLSKRHKNNRKSKCDLDTHAFEHGVRSGPDEQMEPRPILSLTQKEKKAKKRVAFKLSPVLLEPKPPQDHFMVRDIFQTQRSGTEEKPWFNAAFPADGRHGKAAVEEKGMESQSTSDDINSQDLFITQKSFLDPYIDLCCSTSAEEAAEPQCYTETRPEPRGYTETRPEPRGYTETRPEPRGYTETRPEPRGYTETHPGPRGYTETRPEPQGDTETRPEPRGYTETSPEPQGDTETRPEPRGYTETSPEPRGYTASAVRKRSSLEPQCDTSSYPEHQSLPKKSSCPAHHPSLPRKPYQHHKLDTSTQTENFFTSPPLATSLRFLHRSTCPDEPMDLSLPRRSRLHPWDVVSKASEDHHRIPEPNAADPMQSDDSDSHSKSRADLSQLRVVQTRLNESFFFKLKGEGDSPKPRSPLMKLAGSDEKKKP